MRTKLDSCSSVRLPKVVFFSGPLGKKKKKSANDLFILIYCLFFFSFFLTNPASSSHYRSFLDGGMYGGARAESGEVRRRWSVLESFKKKINNSTKFKLRRTCWLWVERRLVSAKKKWFLWPVCTDGTCCMNVLLWMYKRVSNFVCAYHLHYIVMAYLFLRRKKKH